MRPFWTVPAPKCRALAADRNSGFSKYLRRDPAAVFENIALSLDRLAGPETSALGVAISGGSDSTALLLASHRWAERRGGIRIVAATIDHCLRPESGEEARHVSDFAARLGIQHVTMTWGDGPDAKAGHGNLPHLAREARHRLLSDWTRREGLDAVLLGHTQDDQAETVLMRLMRGSGADGLSAMAPSVEIAGTRWLRPMLGIRRDDLRAWLRLEGVGWVEDPTNDDMAYDRVRIRRAIATLRLDVEGLAETADRLGAQARILEAARNRLAETAARIGPLGELFFDVAALTEAEEDTRLAVLGDACAWIGGANYRPRFKNLRQVWKWPSGGALQGCQLVRRRIEGRDALVVCREPVSASREPDTPVASGQPWDNRWLVETTNGTMPEGARIAMMGEAGLAAWKARAGKRAEVRFSPYPARLSAPGIWIGTELAAAPGFPGEDAGIFSARAVLKSIPARFGRSARL